MVKYITINENNIVCGIRYGTAKLEHEVEVPEDLDVDLWYTFDNGVFIKGFPPEQPPVYSENEELQKELERQQQIINAILGVTEE